jgi:hypothetical protein
MIYDLRMRLRRVLSGNHKSKIVNQIGDDDEFRKMPLKMQL